VKFCNRCGKPAAETRSRPSAPEPRSYTPRHLAEKILTSRSALEGERKQVTVLLADVKGSMDQAPNKEAAAAVHREAHPEAMADEIIEVKEGS